MKCKQKRSVDDSNVTSEDQGKRRLLRAQCPVCSTKMAKFGKAD